MSISRNQHLDQRKSKRKLVRGFIHAPTSNGGYSASMKNQKQNISNSAKKINRKLVRGFTCGAFDILHAGHYLMLKEAREQCDYLIVFLQTDPSLESASYRGKKKNKPIQSVEERRIQLEGCRYVDEIIVYTTEDDLYKKLKKTPVDIRIIGSDWKGKKFTGHDLPIKVYFNSRDHHFSTTELRERVAQAEAQKKSK